MTSDYLKQLQLTKQLEQKAKEATKNRKAAEEKLAEAEHSLELARSMEVDTLAIQKVLAEGQAAYAKRDFSTALAQALKVLEDLSRLEGDKVNQALEAALGVLAMIADQGEDRQAVEDLIASSRGHLARGRYEEAMTDARKAGEAAEQYADQRMHAMFSQAQKLIDLAEEKRLAVSAKKQILAKSIKLHEDGDREASLAKLSSCYKGLQESFSKLLEERISAILEMAGEASGTGGDISTITDHVSNARKALADGKVAESFDIASEAEKAIIPMLITAARVKLAAQEERSNWLQGQGVNITRFVTASRKAADAAASGDGEGALEWLRRGEKALRDGEVELVLDRIEKLRPRLVLAKKVRADIEAVVSKLEEARGATVYGHGREALELVSEASAELDDSLAGYRELGEGLNLTRDLFLQARRMKVVSSEASAIVAKARQSALGGRLRESVEELAAARALMLGKAQQYLARDLMNGELLVTAGWSVGADVDETAKELEILSEGLLEGSIEDVGERLTEINQALKISIKETVGEMVEQAEHLIVPALGLSEMAGLRKRYEEARTLMGQEHWYRAYALAEDIISEAKVVQRTALDDLNGQASALLEIGRLLGIESQTLEQKMADIEAGEGSYAVSIRSIQDVIHRARSLIKDEITRALAQVQRSSSAARKNGVTTASTERLVEEASKALVSEDMEKCFNLLKEAEKELEKTISLHNEVYDLIALLSRLTSELRLPPEGKMPQLLQETKRLFETGRYDGARTSARNCYQEAELIGAELLAPRKVQEAKELIPVLHQLSLGTEQAEGAVNEAQTLIQRGQHTKAMAVAKDARKKMVELASEKIGAEIEETRAAMLQGGADVGESSAMAIIEKAESLLADKRYSDAVRAIQFAKGEVGQVLALRSAVGQDLAKVEDELREIESLGIEVKDAQEVFEQAIRYRSSGRYNLVVEIARRALHGARTSADEQMGTDLFNIETELNIEDLKGEDLTHIELESKEVFTQKMQQHRYTEARKALEIYHESLRALAQLKDQCASSLSKLAESLVRVPRGSSVMEETERLMTEAQNAYAEGAFKECLGLTEECRASGAAALKWHDRCSRRMEEVAEGLLVGEGRRGLNPEISALLESARKALSEGRYEDMDWALLKGARMHQREREATVHRGLADLINLIRLFHPLELRVEDLPAEAKSLLEVSMADPGEIRNLGETIGAVHGRVRSGIEARVASIRERAGRLKEDSSISLSILAVVERSLEEEKLEQAVDLVRAADRAIGASMNDVQEMRALSHRYHELAAIVNDLGIDTGHHRDLYRQALRSRDVPSAVHRLREAVNAAERATAACLPRLEIRSSELFNHGSSPALQISLDGGPANGEAGTVLWPHCGVQLPGEVSKKGRLSISYRALFLPKPFVTVLEPAA